MSECQRFQLGTVGALSLLVVSSVSILICNKELISSLAFFFGQWFMPLFSFLFFDGMQMTFRFFILLIHQSFFSDSFVRFLYVICCLQWHCNYGLQAQGREVQHKMNN